MQVMEKKWLWMLKGNVCKAKKEGGSGEWLVAIPHEATKNERARRVPTYLRKKILQLLLPFGLLDPLPYREKIYTRVHQPGDYTLLYCRHPPVLQVELFGV